MLKLKGKLLVLTFKAIISALVVLIPLLGVWFSSSLAAYFNGPIWLAVVIGLLFFPTLPLLWDWRGTVRWEKKKKKQEEKNRELQAQIAGVPTKEPERILTFWDRLIVRTLIINLTFLTTLAVIFPDESFTALSIRGDWMVADVQEEWAEPVSDALFATAEGLEFLYHAANDNPYHDYADDDGRDAPTADEGGRFGEPDTDRPDTDRPDTDADEPDEEKRPAMSWPPPDDVHPLVADMPDDIETSIESVGKYIADNESDPFYRVKALYDYVTDRIVYDVEALETMNFPPQDAQTVFDTQIAVCAGYARLLVALGEVTGDDIVYVVGVARNNRGEVGGVGHAWNAARVDGSWYLLDPTWGAGHVDDEFNPEYKPTYLFTPPEVMINTHFPQNEGWQLLEDPLSRGEFLRQPVLRPSFFAKGMHLKEPTRSQISVGTEARVVIDNPRGMYVRARLTPDDGGNTSDCDVTRGDETVIECPLPSSGTYHVQMFGGAEQYGTMGFVGQLEVHGG